MANLFYMPFRPAYDGAGVSVPGAKAYFTLAGTNTPSAPFSDAGLTTPRTNPVIADASGKFPITYLNPATSYRVRVYGRSATVGVDTPLEEYDPYVPGIFADAGALSPVADAAAASAAAAASSAMAAAADAVTADTAADQVAVTEAAILAAIAAAGGVIGNMPVLAASRILLVGVDVSLPAMLLEEGRFGTFRHYTNAAYNAAFGRVLADDIAADTAQGIFVATATGAWVRQLTSNRVDFHWWGVKADGVTNDYAAFNAMLAALRQLRLHDATVDTYQYGNGASYAIHGNGHVYFGANKLVMDWPAHICGGGSGIPGGAGTLFRWAAGTGGIQFTAGSDGWVLDGLTLAGGWANGNEGEYHGIEYATKGTRRNLQIYYFEGDGMVATLGGNQNGDLSDKVFIYGCRKGFAEYGVDCNGCEHRGIVAMGNRWTGIWEDGLIGSAFYTPLCEGNARAAWNTGAAGRPCSYVSYSGNQFAAINGQEAWCATNSPPATATSNQGWAYLNAGGVTAGFPAWFNGISVRAGSGIISTGLNNCSAFYSPYVEIDEWSQFDTLNVVFNPLSLQALLVSNGNYYGQHVANFNARASCLPQGTFSATRLSGADSVAGTVNLVSVHNTVALSGGIDARLGYAVGYEADGVTPCYVASISAESSGANPATNEGYWFLSTRSVGGAMTYRFLYDGPNGCLRPYLDNTYEFGQSANRWKKGWFNTLDISGSATFAAVTASGDITTTAGKIGYTTGAGGQQTQATSKATAVTLNKLCGDITLNNASLAATTTVSFTFNNSQVAADDELRVWVKSGAADPSLYNIVPSGNGSGSRTIYVRNLSAGALGEAIVLGFAVHKRVVA